MARRVAICGIMRGRVEVDPVDIIQEKGRAGRPKINPDGTVETGRGDVYFVVPEDKIEECKEAFTKSPNIKSSLNNKTTLAFHVTSEIVQKKIFDISSFTKWYERSFAAVRDEFLERSEIESLFRSLSKLKIIKHDEEFRTYEATGLGRVSSLLYFSPYTIANWYFNVVAVIKRGLSLNPLTLSWIFSNIFENGDAFYNKDYQKNVDEFVTLCANNGLSIDPPQAYCGMMYYSIFKGIKIPGTETLRKTLKMDFSRVISALNLIEKFYATHWKFNGWKKIAQMFHYEIPEEYINLAGIPNIGQKKIGMLVEMGYKNLRDIKNRKENYPELRSKFGENMTVKIIDYAIENA